LFYTGCRGSCASFGYFVSLGFSGSFGYAGALVSAGSMTLLFLVVMFHFTRVKYFIKKSTKKHGNTSLKN
jgi:hypothetical protein